MKRIIENKKEWACLCVVVISVLMIGVLCGILASESKADVDKKDKKQQVCATSTLIRYNNSNYQVVPVDMIYEDVKYMNILDKLGCAYEVQNEYVGELLQEIEGGAYLYGLLPEKMKSDRVDVDTKSYDICKDEVLILKDYLGEYHYLFKF